MSRDKNQRISMIRLMELRSHPLISYHGMRSWPPAWKPANPRGDKPSLQAEIGILKYFLCQSSDNRCFLIVTHEDGRYIGCLLFDDLSFCQQLSKILKNNEGRTIKEIGDLDLSFTV